MRVRTRDDERAASTRVFAAAAHRSAAAGRLRRRGGVALYYLVLILAAAVFMVPIVWLILGSLKLNAEFRAYPIAILPRTPIWDNYYDALTLVPFFIYAGRSLWLASLYTFLVVISSAF